jgi:hypothetical protein
MTKAILWTTAAQSVSKYITWTSTASRGVSGSDDAAGDSGFKCCTEPKNQVRIEFCPQCFQASADLAVDGALSAYDAEKRLQAQGLADKFAIPEWMIEAGPTYFDDAVEQIRKGIEATLPTLGKRETTPYSTLTK